MALYWQFSNWPWWNE